MVLFLSMLGQSGFEADGSGWRVCKLMDCKKKRRARGSGGSVLAASPMPKSVPSLEEEKSIA